MIPRDKQSVHPPRPEEKGSRKLPDDRKASPVEAPQPELPPKYADPVDNTLADSFPASDPPSWSGR